ncbi:MAG: GNAT family N-acetyltransferase [Chloroflexi bacterium]|nr:GNAT family N-acetyltransferase [Chloroflexota bacterium]
MSHVDQLPFALYERVRPLFAQAHFDEACYESVFLGWQPATIFVDDADQPRAALMCRSYEFYLAGDPAAAPDLRQFVAECPPEAGVFSAFYGFAPINAAWKQALLQDLPLEVINRMNFRWVPGTRQFDWRHRLAEMNHPEIRVLPLDRPLAEKLDQDKAIFVIPFIDMFWKGYDNFEKHGYGVVLMVGDVFASACFAISTSPRDAIISIDTAPSHQRKGYATLASGAFIEETLNRGLLPVWDTDDTNEPSYRLARLLGFLEHEPFVELAMPNRGPLPARGGLWSDDPADDRGVVRWRRE